MFEIMLVNPYSNDYNTVLDEALSVHYSGGSDLPDEITEWLKTIGGFL